MMTKIPLFPLNLVLFPGARLPLRIFEPRYTDLVSECLKNDSGFGVCFIRQGHEAGPAAECYEIGTYAKITDWSRLEDGLLGITVLAEKRFCVKEFSRRTNELLEGDIVWLEDDGCENGQQYPALQELMLRVLEHFCISYENQGERMNDSNWLGYRLAEFLPLEPEAKQVLLETNNSEERLKQLQKVLEESNFSSMAES